MKHILVIDVGTSSMRGVLFSEDGQGLHTVQRQYQVIYLNSTMAEQDPADWRDALYAILTEQAAWAKEQGLSIGAVSLTAQRSSVIPVTEKGEPLRRAIMWLDKRNAAICDELASQETEIFSLSGARVNTVFSGGRMAWIKRNEPKIYQKAYKLMTIADYLAWLITGCFKTDHTYGSRSLLMNVRSRQWDARLLELFGIEEEKLCELAAPGSVLGTSSQELAQRTGLPAGTPLISAGGDQQCAALGMGVSEDGDLEITTGTGAFLLASAGQVPENIQPDVICGAHAYPGKYVLESSMLACASLFDWFRSQFYQEPGPAYERIDGEIAASPAGAGGCVALPYFQGRGAPDWNSAAQGGFFHLTLHTSRGDMARAVLEAIALEAANNLEILERYAGKARRIYINGGLTHSEEFNRIQASAYNRPVLRGGTAEQTALGAWASAAAATGLYPSCIAAVQQAKQHEHTTIYEPVPAWVQIYQEKRDEMNRLYQMLYG